MALAPPGVFGFHPRNIALLEKGIQTRPLHAVKACIVFAVQGELGK